jgi:hypothetical protein
VQQSDTLTSISALVQVNATDLETWNPELANAAPVAGSAICVRFPTGNYTLATAPPPGNAAQNSTTNCAQWYTVVTGDGCPSIESKFGLTSAQFSQLNREYFSSLGLTSELTALSEYQCCLHHSSARSRLLRALDLCSRLLHHDAADRSSEQPCLRLLLKLHIVPHSRLGGYVQYHGGRREHFSDGPVAVEP